MSGNLLDTNVIVNVLRGNQVVIDFLNGLDEVYIPSIVVGELLYGAKKSSKTDHNLAMVHALIDDIEVLPVDEETAEIYSSIKQALVSTGFNLPENDLWIAATAQKSNLVLATSDAHFEKIHSIQIIRPTE